MEFQIGILVAKVLDRKLNRRGDTIKSPCDTRRENIDYKPVGEFTAEPRENMRRVA